LFATLVVSVFAFMPWSALPSVTTKTYLLAAGALITLALFILARLSRGTIILPPLMLVLALWLPVIAYALSAAFSGVPLGNTLWGTVLESDTLGFMLCAAVLGTLAAFVLRRSEHYRSFLSVGAYVFGVVAVLQVLVVIVGQFSPSTISPAFSLIGSIDDLAYLLGLGVVGALITFRFLELSKRTHQMLLGSGVLALFLLAVANSSVVWIMLALVALGLFVEAVMQRGPKPTEADLGGAVALGDTSLETDETSHSLVLPLVVLVVSLFFLLSGTLGGALASALNINVLNVRPSWQSTFSVARGSYAETPAFGSGPSTFGAQWLKYRDASLNSTVFWNTNFTSGIGFIPTSLVTTGLVGMIAWIAFLLMIGVFGLRMLILRAPTDPFIRYVAILSFVATLYLFVNAIFGLPNAVILTLAFVFAGLFVSTTRFAAGSQQWGVIFSRSPRLGFIIVFGLTILLLGSVVAAYTLVDHYIATSQLARAGTEFNAGNLRAADEAAQKSIAFSPSASAYQIQAGVAMGTLNQIIASTTMPAATAQKEFQAALSAGINAALTATQLTASDYQNWLILGNLYAQAVPLGVAGAYDSAKTAYLKAQELSPTDPQIPYIIAQLDIANRDSKSAQTALKTAISLKQDYTAAIFLLSQLEVQDGNVKGALTSALAAAYFQPNDPNILFQVGILYAAQNDLVNAAAALEASVAANAQFANARYFLSAVYAKQGKMAEAMTQMQAIADMSAENAQAVTTQLASLTAGKNPFPANLLSITPAAVTE
jgi:tetratricopeptide (TPR) repeat protein